MLHFFPCFCACLLCLQEEQRACCVCKKSSVDAVLHPRAAWLMCCTQSSKHRAASVVGAAARALTLHSAWPRGGVVGGWAACRTGQLPPRTSRLILEQEQLRPSVYSHQPPTLPSMLARSHGQLEERADAVAAHCAMRVLPWTQGAPWGRVPFAVLCLLLLPGCQARCSA